MENLKRNIAIVCGGDSSEHDVSMRSGDGLYSFFDKEKYNVYIVDIKGHLCEACRGTVLGAVEDNVLHFAAAKGL